MTPYPAYKPTGLPWLPQIPEHWDIRKLRTLLSVFSEKGHPDALLLSVVRERGVIIRDTEDNSENHNYIPDELSNYKYVRKGQFAMNKMKAWQGSYGISNHDGIVSPAYFVFNLKEVASDFFNLVIRSKFYVPYFGQASDGIRVGQWDLSIPRMKEIPFVVPPPAEQEQIVRYLDSMTAKINKLIRAKRQQIALLQEQKQAIINQAVTKGLDPDAEMKDSGVWWIGKTPAHWQRIPVKGIANFINGFAFASDSFIINYTFPVVRIGDICDNGDINFNCPLGVEDDNKLDDFIIKEGDILIAMSGATTGKVGMAKLVPNKSFINQRVGIIRSANCRYLYYCLLDHVFQEYVTMLSAGSAQPNLSGDGIKNYQIMRPPQREIFEITNYLDKKCTAIDAAISKHKATISALQEYKNSLVSLVVTGQVDVHNIPVDDFDPSDLVPEIDDNVGDENNDEKKEE